MTRAAQAAAGRGHRWTFWVGLVLIVVGLAITLTAAGSVAIDNWQQRQLNQQWQREQQSVHSASRSTQRHSSPSPPAGAAVFSVRIPKLGYYAAVRQGVTLGLLGLGPGHYPSTAWPGQPGDVGVAAHAPLINFGDVRPGDEIIVQALYGTYRYVVTGTHVVSPSGVGVPAPDGRHRLTVTTCWPLWAGALASRRFVISALQAP